MRRRVHLSTVALDPVSPHALLQERVKGDGWRVLVVCVLLNVTTGRCAEPVLWEVLRRWPNARELSRADEDDLRALLRPLGLWERRTETLKTISRSYADIRERGERPSEGQVARMRGVGRYALDSWRLFVECGRTDDFPDDKELRKYHIWKYGEESR